MPDQYVINVTISMEADETKKNVVRDWLNAQLTTRRADGTIRSASLSISKIVIPETITLSPL